VFGGEKAFGRGVIEEGEEGIIISFDIQNSAGFCVKVELAGGEYFEQLIEGAESSGKCDKGIGQVEHGLFSGVHGGGHDHAGKAGMFNIFSPEGFGNDTPNLTAGGQCAFRCFVHQPNAASSGDETNPLFGKETSE